MAGPRRMHVVAGETSWAPGLASLPLLWGGEARCASPLASIFLGSRLLSGFWTPLATERAPGCSSDGCSESARGALWALKAGERFGGVSPCPRRSQRCISAGLCPRWEQHGAAPLRPLCGERRPRAPSAFPAQAFACFGCRFLIYFVLAHSKMLAL